MDRLHQFRLELEALDRVIAKRAVEVYSPTDELSLEPIAEKRSVYWNFSINNEQIQLTPLVAINSSTRSQASQPIYKTVDVWTPNLQLEPYEQSIKDKWIESSQGAFEDWDPVMAALALVPCPRVLFQQQPAQIQEIDPILEVQTTDNQIAIRPTAWNHGHRVYWSDRAGMIVTESGEMQVFRLRREESQVMQALDWMQALPRAEFEQEFLQRATYLQTIVNLVLPESVAGPVEPEKTTWVMLVRSYGDGSLDYGVRIRNQDGILLRVGDGPLIRSCQHDGKKLQLRRSAIQERAHAAEILLSLGLASDLEGHLPTIMDAVAFMDQVGKLSETIEVLWTKSSNGEVRSLGHATKENVRVEVTQNRDWFQLQGSCTIGDETIEIRELIESLSGIQFQHDDSTYLQLGNKGWFSISQHLHRLLESMRERMLLGDEMTINPMSEEELKRIAQEIEVANSEAFQKCLQRMDLKKISSPDFSTSSGFRATLRDYQREGVEWMNRLSEWGFGGILADDMGLGKTVQTLAILHHRRDIGPALIIAPTSVTFNWMRECEKFAPKLRPKLYRDSNRADMLKDLKAGDCLVCSYGLSLRDAESLQQTEWGTIILDEAQMVKNSKSKTSHALSLLRSSWMLALTGTPLENHLGELWSIFRLVAPGVFGSWNKFSRQFGTPIEKRNDHEARLKLRTRIQPFVLRRTKGEVLKELPPRTEINEFVDLSEAERAIYDRIRLSILGEVDALAKIPQLESRRFKILALLTRLRQVACHVGLVHEQWKGSSAKLLALRERMVALQEEGHRVLIFSQFTSHLDLIRKMLKKERITFRYLDGSTSAKNRQTEVDAFQNGTDVAFLISLKAGGTGLNLTAADYVIHMDPWWNPAVENQATDRAHRIGQTKPVVLYRMIARNTIEEEILKLHESKRDLFDGVLAGSDSAGSLTIDELVDLIRQ